MKIRTIYLVNRTFQKGHTNYEKALEKIWIIGTSKNNNMPFYYKSIVGQISKIQKMCCNS